MKCLIIGHRGMSPGQTSAAIKEAIRAGVDAIELDIRVTKDNKLIIAHDRSIKNFEIKHTTLRQLKTITRKILTLEQALSDAGDTPLILEIKPGVDCEPIVQAFKKLPPKQLANITVASFSYKILKYLYAQLPDTERIVLDSWSGVKARYIAKAVNTPKIGLRWSNIYSAYIRYLNKAGYQLYCYTLNNSRKGQTWAKQGLYGIITDFPGRFKTDEIV